MSSDSPPPLQLPPHYVPWPTPQRALLGKGGASEVWRVKDTHLGVEVALKVLRREGARFQARLEREAAISARVHHPHVVAVTDIGQTPDELPYIAFALANGGSMLDLGVTPPPWPELLELTIQLLEGLAALHSRGILHLDVKLSNLLLHSPEPGVRHLWLADLGVARALHSEEEQDRTVIGTVSYMPAERLTGQYHLWTPASDLFSVGAVLYRLLCVDLPFPARDPKQALRQRQRPPEHLPTRPGYVIPDGLASVILPMLEPDPRARYDSAADAIRALRALPVLDPVSLVAQGPAHPNPSGRSERDPEEAVPAWLRPAPRPLPPTASYPAFLRQPPQSPPLIVHREIPLIGREEEYGQLWRAAGSVVRRGSPVLVHVTGPGGVGCTRLVEEFTRNMEQEGYAEGITMTYGGRGGPTQGLRGAWRRICPPCEDADRYRDDLTVFLARDRGASLASTAEDAEILANWVDPHGEEASGNRSYARAWLVDHLVRRAWRGFSWLWLEDIHLASESDDAWAVVDELFRSGGPVLILATSRSGPVNPALLELKARYRKGFRTLQLKNLPNPSSDALVQSWLPIEPGLTEQLFTHTEGNPGYLKSLLLHWTRADLLELDTSGQALPTWSLASRAPPLPATRRAFARERLEHALDTRPDLLEPLLAVALAGPGTPESVIARVIGEDKLDSLVVAGLVEIQGGAPVPSPAELGQEAPEWVQSPELAARLHASLANAWAEEGDSPEVLARVGTHRALAGHQSAAVAPLDRALQGMQQTLPVREVVDLASLILKSIPKNWHGSHEAWIRAMVYLADAVARAGRPRDALPLDRRVARAVRDPNQVVLVACMESDHLARVEGPEAALRRLEEVEGDLEARRPSVRARFHLACAEGMLAALRPDEAHEHVLAALADQPDAETECGSRLLRARLLRWSDPSIAWHEAMRCIEVARDQGLLRFELIAWGIAAEKMVMLGHGEEALERLRASLQRLRAHGDLAAAAELQLLQGEVFRLAGHVPAARRAWIGALELAGQQDPSTALRARGVLAAAAVALSEVSALRHLVAALDDPRFPGAMAALRIAQPALRIMNGEQTALPSRAEIEEAALLGMEGLVLVRATADLLRKTGDHEAADQLVEELIRAAGRVGVHPEHIEDALSRMRSRS